jgi:transcription elongation factor Elf1
VNAPLRRTTSREEKHVAAQELPPQIDPSATCPGCGTELAVARITPVLFGSAFEELTLACKACGFTKKIRIKRA